MLHEYLPFVTAMLSLWFFAGLLWALILTGNKSRIGLGSMCIIAGGFVLNLLTLHYNSTTQMVNAWLTHLFAG